MKKITLSITAIAYILSVSAQTQEPFPNGGFEDWTQYTSPNTLYHPDQYNSLNYLTYLLGIVTCVEAGSPDVHGGSSALKLKSAASVSAPSGIIPGMVTTGTINPPPDNSITGGIAFTSRPDSVVAWMKYTSGGNDVGYVEVLLFDANANDTIGRGKISLQNTVSSFTRVAGKIDYFSSAVPSLLRVIINSDQNFVANSELWVDDAMFVYNPTSIKESSSIRFNLFPNPANDAVELNYNESELANFILFDTNGKVVKRQQINNKETSINVSSLPEATYLYKIENSKGASLTGHVVVKR